MRLGSEAFSLIRELLLFSTSEDGSTMVEFEQQDEQQDEQWQPGAGAAMSVLKLKFWMNTSLTLFLLQDVQLNMTLPDAREATFFASNHSLRALQATIENSYVYNPEEHIYINKAFSFNVFSIQVQAFTVESDRFGSVEVYVQQDGNNMLIPIAVGGALQGWSSMSSSPTSAAGRGVMLATRPHSLVGRRVCH
ncbi:Lysosome-associated membrane glycoprotein 1 [Microtus ochrogaster]|uniref:CD107 antigen-like family member A n=1 Tax=Microtus ochrogaster TaxID=79684 RepID=A0A8J6KQB8_MICOH|nr:Lysosome-associated membrane glycoprotein 1 [Microtus ochrogaster]